MDFAAPYTLTPPAGPAVLFNTGIIGDGTDVFFITNILGLDSAAIRAPQFKRPLAPGGFKPVPWLEDPLHPRIEGAFLIQTVSLGGACQERRNEMYHELKDCLRACYGTTPGVLTWSELGIGNFTLPVSYEVNLTHGFDAGFSVMTFQFGLYSEASQPVAA